MSPTAMPRFYPVACQLAKRDLSSAALHHNLPLYVVHVARGLQGALHCQLLLLI